MRLNHARSRGRGAKPKSRKNNHTRTITQEVVLHSKLYCQCAGQWQHPAEAQRCCSKRDAAAVAAPCGVAKVLQQARLTAALSTRHGPAAISSEVASFRPPEPEPEPEPHCHADFAVVEVVDVLVVNVLLLVVDSTLATTPRHVPSLQSL